MGTGDDGLQTGQKRHLVSFAVAMQPLSLNCNVACSDAALAMHVLPIRGHQWGRWWQPIDPSYSLQSKSLQKYIHIFPYMEAHLVRPEGETNESSQQVAR